MRRALSYLLFVALLVLPRIGHSVIFYSTGDPAYNATEPMGSLTNAGWNLQGTFNLFLGTPIAPHHFITAQHVSGVAVGGAFTFDGTVYTTIGKVNDPNSDLTLWEINGTFSRYAALNNSDESNLPIVVFGRGVERGAEVPGRGWKWGADTAVMRWGENQVAGFGDYTVPGDEKLLRMEFNSGAGANECMLADKDSGGAVFIEVNSQWKLAGINYAVAPSLFSYNSDGSNPFNAALYDYSKSERFTSDFYYKKGTSWTSAYNKNGLPCSFYATRISSRYSWITNNIPDFDQDVDGLPDWWEMLYGGGPTSLEREAHDDSDSFTNYEEWLADTNPTDENSFLQMMDYTNATSVMFSSSTNRKYQVQYRTDLADTNAIWQTEVDWDDGSLSQTVWSVSDVTSTRFYRVRAKPR